MLKYEIITSKIIERITNGETKDGDKLPSEKMLAEEYNVSINTIRKALSDLITSGYILSRQGSGYFVNTTRNFESLTLKSLKAGNPEKKVESQILNFELIQATREQADKLNIEVNSAMFFIKRLRYIDDKPQQIEYTYVPVQIFPTLDKSVFEDSFYSYIEEQTHLKISRANKDISALNIDEENAKLLELETGSAVIVIENYGFLSDGTQFEYSYNIHGDKRISINVTNK